MNGTVDLKVSIDETGRTISRKSGKMIGCIVHNSGEMVRPVTLGNYDIKKGKNIISIKTVGRGATEADTA